MSISLTRIANSIGAEYGVSPDGANAISLHIGDAYSDWKKLISIIENKDTSEEDLADEIYSMLMHTTNHLIAAAHLMHVPITDVWSLGISIESR